MIKSKYLKPLIELAKHFDSFEEFEKYYVGHNFHGVYWHLTNDPNFQINPKQSPTDLSSLSFSQNKEPGLMVSTDLGNWYETFKRTRKFAALIDLTNAKPNVDYKRTTRGFGHEMYINKPEKARVIKVLPIQQALKLQDYIYKNVLPSSKEDLEKIYNMAHGKVTNEGMIRLLEIFGAKNYWMMPNGVIVSVDDHIDWILENADLGFNMETGFPVKDDYSIADPGDVYDAAFKKGYIRLSKSPEDDYPLYVDYDIDRPPTNLQWRNIRNMAIENQWKLVDRIKNHDVDLMQEAYERKLGKTLKDEGYLFRKAIIYRAMPATEKELKSRDYVTTSKKFAIEHANHMTSVEEELYHVMAFLVLADKVYKAYENPGEYFYDGPKPFSANVIYKATDFL